MVADKVANRFVKKHDFIHLIILLTIAAGIGIYLIITTTLIAKDGVFYIEQAQKLSSDPIGIIKAHPPGYPFLIFMAHKFAILFSNSSSVYTWIHSAQSITLLCRLLALIPLYFMGKLLVGGKNSFWAILILIFLPYPARFGSDALRDWPHILFLATGFLLLLQGAKRGNWWMFGAVGLAAGLGHIIRPECAQLVIYAGLWLLIRLFRPTRAMHRPRLTCALFVLLIGFAIPAAPYMKARGKILPTKLKALTSSSCQLQSGRSQESSINNCKRVYTAVGLSGNVVKAFGRLIERIGEHLMYFFVPPLLIGFYSHFRKRSPATDIGGFFISAFIVLNIAMMILLHYNYEYISRRHCLPLVVFSIFYIPVGLQILANWLTGSFSKSQPETNQNPKLWFFVLLAIGLAICLPKLLRPIRMEKQAYRTAADWLKENTASKDVIAVQDKRIAFYAERKGRVYTQKVPVEANYAVKIYKDEYELVAEKELLGAKKIFSFAYRNTRTHATIYDIRGYISEKLYFVEYRCEKISDDRYKFYFVFEVNNKFEKDWIIHFHGHVKNEDLALLPQNHQKYKFHNWDFRPKPTTSAWPGNGVITVTREVSAKPIPYNLRLGFYRVKEGRHGRQINLGWVDLGDIKQANRR